MIRRVSFLLAFLVLCASSAWPKFSDEDKKYLDEQFRSIADTVQAMQAQIQTLNAQLQQLKENQAALQVALVRQMRAINDINQKVDSMNLGSEDHYSTLKAALEKLRSDTQASFNKISPGAGGGGGALVTENRPQPVAPKPALHYVTDVKGNDVLVDLTSADGVQQGTRLGLYKAADPNTHVGVLEVTQVTESGSHAKILGTNSGVKPDFGDIVRIEQ